MRAMQQDSNIIHIIAHLVLGDDGDDHALLKNDFVGFVVGPFN